MARANAALQYHPDGFEMTGPKPMGRQSAGRGLLEGFVRHAGAETLIGYGDPRAAQAFERSMRALGSTRPVQWATPMASGPLLQAGTLHLAGPGLDEQAWLRRSLGQRAYSLTGVTHTVASARVMTSLTGLLAAPVQDWDALICTSRAVKAMVERLMDDQADYLAGRLEANTLAMTRPQLPVIPLGIDCREFTPDPQARARMRAQLGVAEEAVLFLMAGRLSFHAKAHPHPMYLALQRAAERTGTRPHLLLASWFANEGQEKVFRQGAAELCPHVTVHVLDGRQAGVWSAVWRAGDVYTLLSDNIQESFGLAPVEAMAAGLPVVGSDWDGLRDTVLHGETGFLADTVMPAGGAGEALARLHASEAITYDQYIGAAAQSTAVDVAQVADAYAALLSDAGLRLRMGASGRRRAETAFDWSAVIPAYQALWTELGARRRAGAESAPTRPNRPADPARSDPFRHFAAHATRTLAPDDRLRPTVGDLGAAVSALLKREGGTVVSGLLASGKAIDTMVARVGTGTTLGALLAADGHPAIKAQTARTVAWLLKFGLLTAEPAPVAEVATP